MKRKHLLAVLCFFLFAGVAAGCGTTSSDQEKYPTRAIELYVPADPGGATDTSARIMAQYMKKYLGQDIVIINEGGGGGTIATETVRKAPPDGYKLLYFHEALLTGYATNKIKYDPVAELTAIGTYGSVNQAYVVSAKAPWNTLQDFVNDAKKNPDKYKFGAQLSATTHFMAAMLEQKAGIKFQILDSGSESERMAALLGGQLDIAVTSVKNALNYSKSGDFKVLAVLTEERDPLAPNFPTAKEQGYDIVISILHTLYGPKDLPANVVKAWNDATEKLAKDPEYIEALRKVGQVHVLKNSAEATEFAKKERDELFELGKQLGF